MFFSLTSLALALAASPVFGKIYTTNPVATTTGTGGQVLTVQWADDGNSPTLGEIGPCSVDLYTGSVYKQIQLQNLAASVDVSRTAQISTTIDPTAGETGPYYFVRFTSLGLKDSQNAPYPYQAFSAKFTLEEMSGQFNASIMADISAGNSASSAPVSTASARSTSGGSSSTVARPAASSTSQPNGAAANVVSTGLIFGMIGLSAYIAL